jgi:succinoglycan biosynthesis transport protein ExoP
MRTKTSNSTDDFEPESGLDLSAIYHTCLEKWWLVLLCLAACLGLGFFYISHTPKTYRSEAEVEVEQNTAQVLAIQDVTSEDLKEQEVLKTIEARLVSVQDLADLIQREHLTPADLDMPPRKGPFTDQNPDYIPQELVAALADEVSAKLTRGTRLITVSAVNTKPKTAQLITTGLIAEYIRSDTAERAGISGEANRFLLEQADMLKQRVSIAEQAAQSFKDAHPGVALDDTKDFIDGKLRDLTNLFYTARQNRIRLESDSEQVQRILQHSSGSEQTDQLLTVQSVAADPGVLQIEKSISDEEAVFASMKQRYLPKHPTYIQEQSKLAGLKLSLQVAVFQAAKSLAPAVESARQDETKMQRVLADEEQQKANDDKLNIPYTALTREVDRNRDLYDSVEERLKETDLTTNMDDSKIQTVSPATLPYVPYKPKPVLVLLACTVVGLLLSFAACFALSMTDNSLRTVDEAEEALGLQAVGAIPVGDKLGFIEDGIAILEEPDGAIAESFRTLRAALGLLDDSGAHRVFLFTSGVPGEGKSYCSINYAISLAQLGRKTLLIDSDLRLPSIEPIFFKDKKVNGLSVLLEGKATLDQCYYPTIVPNLFVMPAGRRSQTPSELIANTDFPRLITAVSAEFDDVVIDSSPVHAVSDTLLIAKHADVVCLVVHASKTPAKVALRAVQKLEGANAKPAGFILNRLPKSSADYYYYYGGGGSYGKGVYGASEASKA